MAATAAQTPATRFLDPRVLARLGSVELIARAVVGGFISGLHRSPLLGLSVDFAEHRSYMPGDDVRRIDWRLYARTDRLYVKETESDTNVNVTLLLDVSKSMDYASGGISKLDYVRFAAASLAYLSNRQRDRIGLVTFDAEPIEIIPPAAKHYDNVLRALETLKPGGAGALGPPLQKVADLSPRRGIVVLLSDLYEPPEQAAAALAKLRLRGNDVIVLHVLDPVELSLDVDAAALSFADLETGEQLPVLPEQFRAEYRERVRAHVDALRRRLGDVRVDYALFDTSQPLDHLLFRYLSDRQRLSRIR